MAKVIELIYTEQTIGAGTPDDPRRTLYSLWTKGGRLIAEEDIANTKDGTPDLRFLIEE